MTAIASFRQLFAGLKLKKPQKHIKKKNPNAEKHNALASAKPHGFKARASKALASMQRLGKALIYPIAVLPFAALLNRFGALGVQVMVTHNGVHEAGWWIAMIIQTPGATVFNNLPIIFAIGVGFGLSKDFRGEVALVSAMVYLILQAFIVEQQGGFGGTTSLSLLIYGHVLPFTNSVTHEQYSYLFYLPQLDTSTHQITGQTYILDTGVLGGICSGGLSAFLYNRLKDVVLPDALAFFGGRRFVPMVAGLCSVPFAFLFAIIWPWIQYVLVQFGNGISSSDTWAIPGAFLYGIINRLAQPFGVHHIINTFLWFQLPIHGTEVAFNGDVLATNVWVNGDITAFNHGIAQSGVFESGYFPLYMGGEPAIAIAMMFAVPKGKKRKETGVFLAGVAAVAFLTGIDEPLVFSFIFISPLLWVIYAFYTGVFAAIVIAMHIHLSFGFSAGLIDYIISFAQSWGNAIYNGNTYNAAYHITGNPLWILPLSAIAFAVYFFTFLPIIKKLNLPTPGREPEGSASRKPIWEQNETAAETTSASGETLPAAITGAPVKIHDVSKIRKLKQRERHLYMAQEFVAAVQPDNIDICENCTTRVRLVVKNMSKVNMDRIKAAGAAGIRPLGDNGLQIIVGTDVEGVANDMNEILDEYRAYMKSHPKAEVATATAVASTS